VPDHLGEQLARSVLVEWLDLDQLSSVVQQFLQAEVGGYDHDTASTRRQDRLHLRGLIDIIEEHEKLLTSREPTEELLAGSEGGWHGDISGAKVSEEVSQHIADVHGTPVAPLRKVSEKVTTLKGVPASMGPVAPDGTLPYTMHAADYRNLCPCGGLISLQEPI
jgi:hypothetical protein